MRAVLVGMLFAACHAQKPPPQPAPPTERSAVAMRELAATMTPISRVSEAIPPPPERLPAHDVPARPAFDPDVFLPDVSPILRWPLTASRHPELAPQFAIASALAEPGLDWIALCRLGAHQRHMAHLHDEIAYLGAWCAVGDHDVDKAIGRFAALTRSVVGGLAPAVRADIVNVLVDHGDADDAVRLLSKHRIRDLDVLDQLAATYLDVGRRDDARVINELAIVRDDVSRANRCRRQARRVVMDPEPYRPDVKRDVRLFDEPAGADRTCDGLAAELACWLRPKLDCAPHFKNIGVDPRIEHLIQAHASWPTARTNGFGWLWTADFAIKAGTVARGYDFAVLALESAVRSDGCNDTIEQSVQRRARWLLTLDDRPTGFEQRLRILANDPDLLCD